MDNRSSVIPSSGSSKPNYLRLRLLSLAIGSLMGRAVRPTTSKPIDAVIDDILYTSMLCCSDVFGFCLLFFCLLALFLHMTQLVLFISQLALIHHD